jgi:diguanylate cyclase (GGDEF)-like protein
MKSEDTDFQRAAEVISSDAPLAAKVLNLVNSPYFGMKFKISSVKRAISLMGLNAVKNLALGFSLICNFIPPKKSSFTYSQFWKNSLVGAVAAGELASQLQKEHPEEAFLIGLLQNIGTLILAESYPQEYEKVVEMIDKSKNTIQAETEIFGHDHTVVGENLIHQWGLPEFFAAPIRFHHNPYLLKHPSLQEQSLVDILHLSSLFIELFSSADSHVAVSSIIDYLDACGYSASIDTTGITQRISEKTKTIFPLFDIEIDHNEHIRIIESAKAELSQLSHQLMKQVRKQYDEIEQLAKKAATDGLTRLYNKNHFIETLSREIRRSSRYGTPLSIIMIDIDHFKSINDFYGHLAGDQTLIFIAEKIKEISRRSDYIARFGGEEFVIILPSTPGAEAFLVAERLREAIQSSHVNYRQKNISVTASCGVASLDGRHRFDVDAVIHMADTALYAAKRLGRNKCCKYKQAEPDESRPLILVIDDEEVVLITMSEMLNRLGYNVIVAADCHKAMELFERYLEKIDAIFLDATITGFDTFEILTKIKARRSDVRVFLSSGYSPEHIEKKLMQNCDGFIAKPCSFSELSEKILGKN